jgi:hypothetical protein
MNEMNLDSSLRRSEDEKNKTTTFRRKSPSTKYFSSKILFNEKYNSQKRQHTT